MIRAQGIRIGWADLPRRVQAEVEAIIGATVVNAASQPGGFSPGTADRVLAADGRRAFVKAVGRHQNERSVELHRQEARITAALPAAAPAPRLLGQYDDGAWVALVLQDIPGRHPVMPWRHEELHRVEATLQVMADRFTPAPIDGLPGAIEQFADDFTGWQRIDAGLPPWLEPWVTDHLDVLQGMAGRGLAALDGQTLCHCDVRADNLLIGAQGQVTVVDWPWACRGPAWLDRLILLVNVCLYGGHDVQDLLVGCAAAAGATVEDLTAVLAGFAGYLVNAAAQPAPAGLPTVRQFQREQAQALLSWIRPAVTGEPASRR